MSQKNPTNIAASVHQRITNLARARKEDVNLIFTRYGIERFLYRLSVSPHADSFVLKGAMLFFFWTSAGSRPTRDLDLLANLLPEQEKIRKIFQEICVISVENDGLEFNPEALEVESTQNLRRFGGFRIKVPALLGNVRLQVQIDLGFGDIVVPAPKRITYPTLLDQAAPTIAAYHMETAIAEKTEAIVKLALTNTRTKDYFDLLTLSRNFDFAGADVAASMSATFRTRETPAPVDIPPGLTSEFASDTAAVARWDSFLRRNQLAEKLSWTEALDTVRFFVLPPLHATAHMRDFIQAWTAGGPWR